MLVIRARDFPLGDQVNRGGEVILPKFLLEPPWRKGLRIANINGEPLQQAVGRPTVDPFFYFFGQDVSWDSFIQSESSTWQKLKLSSLIKVIIELEDVYRRLNSSLWRLYDHHLLWSCQ